LSVSFSLYLLIFYHFSSAIKSKKSNPPTDQPASYKPLPQFEPLSPYNWDFRKVPDSLLRTAIRFEYLRSWPEFRAAAIGWLQQKIDGQSIRDHLMDARDKKIYGFPEKVRKTLPPKWHYAFYYLEADCCFPAPFTWLLEKGIIRERPTLKNKSTSFTITQGVAIRFTEKELEVLLGRFVEIHPMNKEQVEFALKMLSFPEIGESYGYHLVINFDLHRNEDLVKAFAYWLAQEAKKKRKIAVHGRASSAKWHRLKQLAAKRLSEAGLNYKDALLKIAEHEKTALLDDKNSVLPKYNSAGAWHDAVKEANLMVEKLKDNFHLNDWELL
jgi:hypothetical protein